MYGFVDHGVISDGVDELVVFSLIGQFAVQQQIASLQETRFFCQLFDWIAAVEKYACSPIYISDFGLTGGCETKPGS